MALGNLDYCWECSISYAMKEPTGMISNMEIIHILHFNKGI